MFFEVYFGQADNLRGLLYTDLDFIFRKLNIPGTISNLVPAIVVEKLVVRILENLSYASYHLYNGGRF